MRFLLLLMTLSVLIAPVHTLAQDGPLPSDSPGVAEVIPRLTRLTEEGTRALGRIEALRDPSVIRNQLMAARIRQQELESRMRQLGDPAGWNTDRLLEMRGYLAEQQDLLDKLQGGLSDRLVELETLRNTWVEKRRFWRDWEKALRGTSPEIPEDAFQRALTSIEAVLKGVGEVFPPLVNLQEDITRLYDSTLDDINRINLVLDTLRGEIFKRTAPSFTQKEFYRQFDGSLLAQIRSGAAAVAPVRVEWLRDHGWVVFVQLLLAASLAVVVRRQRSNPDISLEWQFLLRHPWAAGIFVAVSALGFLYTLPPAPWRLLLWGLLAFSAAVLTSGLLSNPRKILMVNLLAGLFVLSMALQIIAFPEPLYRLYIALISLLGIPLLLLLARRNRDAHEGHVTGFGISLLGGTVILVIAFLAQFAGYGALSSRLIESSVGSVFLILFAAMVIRLGRGGIEIAFRMNAVRSRPFFRRFGEDLAGRLKGVFEFLVAGYVLLYLLVAWHIYGSVSEAWKDLITAGVSFGEFRISVQMVVLVGVVLYASIVLSWFIRALLDVEFFPRQGLDRGVRDSVKKLLHYCLVLVGLLLALSLAGIELKNLTVLAGAFGIGIGFGLQNIVNNFVSGLILLFERPVKVGDMIVVDEEWGTVRKMGLRSTVIETLDQAEIIVPNSDLISEKVTNWTLSTRGARVMVAVGVAYGSDVEKVLEILQEAARENGDVLKEPSPSALFMGFGESSLDFELRVWIADVGKRLVVKSELGRYIDRRFREAAVEIPFPQRDLHLRSVDGRILTRFSNHIFGAGDEKKGPPPPGKGGPS